MGSKGTASLAFLISLNLVFFTLVSAHCDNCYVPEVKPPPKPEEPCPPVTKPTPKPSPTGRHGKCPKRTLNLGVCAKVLGGLIDVKLGQQPVTPCCNVIKGLVDLDAAVCVCTAIKAGVLGKNIINIPLSIQLLLNVCKKNVPKGFKC